MSGPTTPAGLSLPPVWPPPRSLATTRGISFDFSSSGYLDVSVPPVAPRAPMSSAPGGAGRPRAGFSHSDTRGSQAMCASPRIIAACHVLRRLPVPRHPPSALAIFLLISMDGQACTSPAPAAPGCDLISGKSKLRLVTLCGSQGAPGDEPSGPDAARLPARPDF